MSITHASIIPLIGGETIGSEKAFSERPIHILSYERRANFKQNTKWIWHVNSILFENCFSAKEFAISKIDNGKISSFKKISLDTQN